MKQLKIARHEYKGYIIDVDNLGRPYIYNMGSPYAEDSDKIIVHIERVNNPVSLIKRIIDERNATGRDIRHATIDTFTGLILVY